MFVNGLYSSITVFYLGLRLTPARIMYLVASLDLHTRYVLSWELSNTLDTDFCLAAMKKDQPEITDRTHGAQFASCEFAGGLEASGIRISMDPNNPPYNPSKTVLTIGGTLDQLVNWELRQLRVCLL